MPEAANDGLKPPSSPLSERVVPCPACGADSVFGPRNPYRPFCSARCKNMDWGAWSSETFRVATAPPDSAEGSGSGVD